MFYDLNVPWPSTTTTQPDPHLPRTLAFLHELGYTVLALNHTITGKLPATLTNAIPTPLPPHLTTTLPPRLQLLRRVTLILTETHQNARLAALASHYDLLAVRPVDERSLQLACASLDCAIISLDLTQRLGFFFKHKMLMEAIRAGKKFEICYAAALAPSSASSGDARRNLISNATQLIRATRGRGIIISSEARRAVACRGPWDVINLAAVWGLGTERGAEALGKEARGCVVQAGMKRSGYRGVVDVVFGGEKGDGGEEVGKANGKVKGDDNANGQKRKADAVEGAEKEVLSKTQMKKRAKLEAAERKKKEGAEQTASSS